MNLEGEGMAGVDTAATPPVAVERRAATHLARVPVEWFYE